MTQILNDILKLSESERILTVEAIWDSITSKDEEFKLTDELKELLDERLAEHEKNPKAGYIWNEVKSRIL
ncbi:MAG TPA: addiction module protein [Bacteroidales bacterium]